MDKSAKELDQTLAHLLLNIQLFQMRWARRLPPGETRAAVDRALADALTQLERARAEVREGKTA